MLSYRIFPRVLFFAIPDGPADNLPLSIDHLLAFIFLARISFDIFRVRQRPIG